MSCAGNCLFALGALYADTHVERIKNCTMVVEKLIAIMRVNGGMTQYI